MTSSIEQISEKNPPEKSSIVDVSTLAADSVSQNDIEKDSTFALNTPEAQEEIRRAVRKMDLTVIPIMTIFYFLSFLVCLISVLLQLHMAVLNTMTSPKDRANIGTYANS
jgi:hypothetical protein